MQITESDAWYISPRTIVNFTHTKSTHQVQVQPKKFVRNSTKKKPVKTSREPYLSVLPKSRKSSLEGVGSHVCYGDGLKWGLSCGAGRVRYLRALRGRFSVNLRVIPVISCLENHAVALMLHCLSRSFPPRPFCALDCTLYYSQFTPTILAMSLTEALILLTGSSRTRPRCKGRREKTDGGRKTSE